MSMSVYVGISRWFHFSLIVVGDGIELGCHRGTFLVTLLMLDSCSQGWGLWRDPKCAQRESCVQYRVHEALHVFAPSFDDLFDVNTVNMYFFCPVTGFATSSEMRRCAVLWCNLERDLWCVRITGFRFNSLTPGCGSAVPYVAGCQTSESQWNMVKLRPDQANLYNQLNHVQFGSRTIVFSGKRCIVFFFLCRG